MSLEWYFYLDNDKPWSEEIANDLELALQILVIELTWRWVKE